MNFTIDKTNMEYYGNTDGFYPNDTLEQRVEKILKCEYHDYQKMIESRHVKHDYLTKGIIAMVMCSNLNMDKEMLRPFQSDESVVTALFISDKYPKRYTDLIAQFTRTTAIELGYSYVPEMRVHILNTIMIEHFTEWDAAVKQEVDIMLNNILDRDTLNIIQDMIS